MKALDLRKVEITKSELHQVLKQLTLAKECILEFPNGDLKDSKLAKVNVILNKMWELNNKSNTFK